MQDPLSLLQHLLTAVAPALRPFHTNIRAYTCTLSMVYLNADWLSKGLGSSLFNPPITVHGQIHHFLGAEVPLNDLRPCFFFVFTHDTDHIEEGNERAVQRPNLSAQMSQSSTQILLKVILFIKPFVAHKDWRATKDAPNPHRFTQNGRFYGRKLVRQPLVLAFKKRSLSTLFSFFFI